MGMNRNNAVMIVLAVALGMIVTLTGTAAYAGHVKVDGTVSKIQSDVVYAKTPWGHRIIGTAKQLGDVRVGDRVAIWLNEDNSIIDVRKDGETAPKHAVLNGHVVYSTPAKTRIRLWTAEGKKELPVATSAVARLNAIPEGAPVTVELNEQGQVIDIQKMVFAVPAEQITKKA